VALNLHRANRLYTYIQTKRFFMATGTAPQSDQSSPKPENPPSVATDGKVVVFLFILGFFLLSALILGELLLKLLP
jgi:hypothetical protein